MAHRWRVLAVVSAAVFVAGLDMFIVNIAFPDIERAFRGAGVASVSWVLNGYAIVLAALLVPAGRVADRYGRRRIFLSGLVVFVIGSILCGTANSVAMLVGARAVQALGAACLLPTSLALLLPEFAPAERPAAIGLWAAAGGLAAAFGPPLGGLLVQASWRLVFLVNVPVILATFGFAWRLLHESRDPDQERPDVTGALILAAATALIALGMVETSDWGWVDVRTWVAVTGGVLGLLGFWIRCRSHPSPLVDPAMLRVRSYALANVAALLFSAAFAAMLLSVVLFMTGVWRDSILVAGCSLAPGPLVAGAVAPRAGRLAARVAQRRLAAIGLMLFAGGCGWWLWRLDPHPAYAAEMLPGLLLTGVGVGLTLPSLASAAAAALPPARFATGSAVFTMSRQLGFVLGIAILIAILGSTANAPSVRAFEGGWLFMVITSVLASAAATMIGRIGAPVVMAGKAARPLAASSSRTR